MTKVIIPIDEKTEDAINAIRTQGREPIVFTNYYSGKGRVLEILDDEQSKTKTKQCIVCGVFGEPKKMVDWRGKPDELKFRAHPECRALDERRGMFRKEEA